MVLFGIKLKPSKKDTILRTISILVICLSIISATLLINWTQMLDRITGLSFEPTPEMTTLAENLNLTTAADIIYRSTHPTIKDRTEFNQICTSANEEISILGCFDGRQIYIFNITNPELSGIKESTLAHELLHAIWDRISPVEQIDLEKHLGTVYAEHKTELEPRLKLYSDTHFYEELHSIIGTEFAALPTALETYYAQYFVNQDTVVSYFEKYDAKFQKLKKEADDLRAQITSNIEIIDAETENYNDASAELSAAVADFNNRVESGAYTSIAAIQAERNVLLTRQSELQVLYDRINSLVITTKQLGEQYETIIAQVQFLFDSINSQTQAPTTTPDPQTAPV